MKRRVLLVKLDKPAGGPQHLSFSEPIGICYLASHLRQSGIDAHLCHLIKDDAEQALREQVRSLSPEVIGFSVRNFNFPDTQHCIQMVRAEFPSISVAIGGECVTRQNAADLVVRAEADIAFVSDSEDAFLMYVQGAPPATIPGVAFVAADGTGRLSDKEAKAVDPSRLPMMCRDGLPMDVYTSEGFAGRRYATLHAQRGCRYRCTFCHTACRYAGHGPMSRTAKQILDEVDYLTVNYHVEALAIWDEDFFADESRVEGIVHGLQDRGSPVEWQTFMKLTDLQSKSLLRLLPRLRDARYKRAIVGLESFLPATLREYHKAGGPNVEERLQRLTEVGITVCPSYIVGAPDETEDDVRYGLRRLLSLRESDIAVDLPYVAFITPFPGTMLYDDYVKRGLIIDDDWGHYDGEHVVVRGRCPPDRLIALRDEFYRCFYGAAR